MYFIDEDRLWVLAFLVLCFDLTVVWGFGIFGVVFLI